MRWEDQVPEQALFAMVFDQDNSQRVRLPIALAHGASYRQVVTNLGGLIGASDPIESCALELVQSMAERTVAASVSDEHGRQAFIDILAQLHEGEITDYTSRTVERMWESTLGRDSTVDCHKGEFVDPMFAVRTRLRFERGDAPMGDMSVQILAGEGFSDLADVMDNPVLWTGMSGFHVDVPASRVLNNPSTLGYVLDGFFVNSGYLWRPGTWELVAWGDSVWWIAWASMLM